jgi:hypothetical protein
MAKGSVEDFRPEYPDGREYYSENDLEAIIRAAGGLPDGEVDHLRPAEDGSELVPAKVSRRVALKERLESAARYWDIARQYANKPTPPQTAEDFKKIERRANSLLIALQLHKHDFGDDVLEKLPPALRDGFEDEAQKDAGVVSVQEDLSNGTFTRDVDILQPNGADLLVDAIRGVYRLRDWSRARGTRTAEAIPHHKRYEADLALDELFKEIALIWTNIFKRELRFSVGAPERPSKGKATGPVVRFFRACLEPLLHEQAPTNDAIRARIRRLLPSLVKPS